MSEESLERRAPRVDPNAVYVHLIYIKESVDEIKTHNAARDERLGKIQSEIDQLKGAISATNFYVRLLSLAMALATGALAFLNFVRLPQ